MSANNQAPKRKYYYSSRETQAMINSRVEVLGPVLSSRLMVLSSPADSSTTKEEITNKRNKVDTGIMVDAFGVEKNITYKPLTGQLTVQGGQPQIVEGLHRTPFDVSEHPNGGKDYVFYSTPDNFHLVAVNRLELLPQANFDSTKKAFPLICTSFEPLVHADRQMAEKMLTLVWDSINQPAFLLRVGSHNNVVLSRINGPRSFSHNEFNTATIVNNHNNVFEADYTNSPNLYTAVQSSVNIGHAFIICSKAVGLLYEPNM